MNIAILGSGFGIYGYLPAACSLGWEVTTLSSYREKITSRKELSGYLQNIEFVESESDLLALKLPLVFARTPKMQFEFLNNYLKLMAIPPHLYLEKPLTNSTYNSEIILDSLRKNRISFSVGYLFEYTRWFLDLSKIVAAPGNNIVINWRIPVTNSDWKNSQEDGGGLFYFFLVHFVPVLTKLGYRISNLEVRYSNGKCTLKGVGDSEIEINAEIVSEDFQFELLVDKRSRPLFRSQTPFGIKPLEGTPDPRIESLKRYLKSSLDTTFDLDSAIETELEVIKFLKHCFKATAV